MASFLKLPDLALTLLADGSSSSLSTIQDNKQMVIDFWTTRCTRCPAALEKVNVEAGKAKKSGKETVYLSCALSQGAGNQEVAADLVNESDLENLTHVFMSEEVKEEAKKIFGFTAVPFVVVVDKDGHVLGSGDPKNVDYNALFAASESNTSSTDSADGAKTAASTDAPVASSQKQTEGSGSNKLPSLDITVFDREEKTTLTAFQNGRPMILDFWTTKCTRCPAALKHLDDEAAKAKKAGNNTLYAACVLLQNVAGDQDFAAELVNESELENLTHIIMSAEVKEAAKKIFGFSAVPFLLVVDKNGNILGKGEPKSIDAAALIAASEGSTENNENDENNAKTRNVAPVVSSEPSVKVAAEPAAPVARPAFVLDEDF